MAPWDNDDYEDHRTLRTSSPSPVHGGDHVAVPQRKNWKQRTFDDDFGLKLMIIILLTFMAILIILCKLFVCKKLREIYAPPPPYMAFTNDASVVSADDKPPLYADVLMGDYASEPTKFPVVELSMPETPPPKYDEGNMMKF